LFVENLLFESDFFFNRTMFSTCIALFTLNVERKFFGPTLSLVVSFENSLSGLLV
jgi:hypothetical protein